MGASPAARSASKMSTHDKGKNAVGLLACTHTKTGWGWLRAEQRARVRGAAGAGPTGPREQVGAGGWNA
jgi:hypothetical protein